MDATDELRLEVQKGLEAIWELEEEHDVRNRVSSLNSLIVRMQMVPLGATGDRIPLLNDEEIVRKWRERHHAGVLSRQHLEHAAE